MQQRIVSGMNHILEKKKMMINHDFLNYYWLAVDGLNIGSIPIYSTNI